MIDVKIKICGLNDPDIAAKTVKLGVDYIGLIFHPESKRYVDMDLAILIANAVHANNGKIVPVFVDQIADEILDIAAKLEADLIQLHGVNAIMAYSDVCDAYPCIVAKNLCDNISILNPKRDFLLYDYALPGSGTTFDWHNVTVHPDFRSFIAGGININNAVDAITHFHPFALDISSGVECAPGVKDLSLIKELLNGISKGD